MKKIGLLLFVLIGLQSFAQVEKTAIVEHFTNTRCAVCGYKNPPMYVVLNAYPDVLHISYHPTSPYPSCIFSQHNPEENDGRATFYNVYGGTPKVVLNGVELAPQAPMVKEEDLDAAIEEMSEFSVVVTQSEPVANQVNVLVKIEKLAESSESNMSLYIALAENTVNYSAPNGEDVHHQVFRLVLGEELIESMEVDEIKEFNYTYEFHEDWVMEEMFAFAILQDDYKMVLQSDKSPLVGDLTGIEDQLLRDGLINIGPNPTSRTLNITHSSEIQFNELSMFNIYGQLVLNQSFSDVINVEPLEPGLYIVQMQTIRGDKVSLKFQKN